MWLRRKCDQNLRNVWDGHKLLDLEELESDLETELEHIDFNYEPATLVLDKHEVPPCKGDIPVDQVQLVWLPSSIDSNGFSQPEY